MIKLRLHKIKLVEGRGKRRDDLIARRAVIGLEEARAGAAVIWQSDPISGQRKRESPMERGEHSARACDLRLA